MFRVRVLQAFDTLPDEQTEYQPRDQLSFMRFSGLPHDAKTAWLSRK